MYKMLTNSQLFHLSNAMEFPLEAVCFKNQLPKLKYNVGYIINLQNDKTEDGNDNDGSHWTALQVNKYPTGLIEPIFMDPYGAPPSEAIKSWVKKHTGKALPYTLSDIQSLVNNSCGYYCCAFLYYINRYDHRSKDLYDDVAQFMACFNDLNQSKDYKYNEFALKQFFRSKDPAKRKAIEVITDIDEISSKDDTHIAIPVELKET